MDQFHDRKSQPASGSPPQAKMLREYLCDTLNILERSLAWAETEPGPAYRVTATQLRLLLCDTTRVHGHIVDISLAPRVFPRLYLHPAEVWDEQLRFDLQQPPIPRLDWLGQTLLLPNTPPRSFTLREMIRTVCDRYGGVHVDPQPGSAFLSNRLSGWILETGAYILLELRRLEHTNLS